LLRVTQVAHKGSDKALFPNVLCLLGTHRRHAAMLSAYG
jgi:hypothetical protein